jgi:hypothetical protein
MNMSQSERDPRPVILLAVGVAPLRDSRYVNKSATSRSNVVYCHQRMLLTHDAAYLDDGIDYQHQSRSDPSPETGQSVLLEDGVRGVNSGQLDSADGVIALDGSPRLLHVGRFGVCLWDDDGMCGLRGLDGPDGVGGERGD